MLLQLKRPIVFLDLEATGLNPLHERIVEFGAVKCFPDGRRETKVQRYNPERPIPPETTAIHGIRDQDVANCPTFEQGALELLRFLSGCDIGGFAVNRLDIPLLREEFKRAGYTFDTSNVLLVDTQRIYHLREPRDLSAAVKFYCDEEFEDAHSAEADALASLRVLEGQLRRYSDLPRTVEELDKVARPEQVGALDPDGRLRWRDNEVIISFGQKGGRTLRDLVQTEPNYLRWILNKNFSPEVKAVIKNALEGKFPQRPAGD